MKNAMGGGCYVGVGLKRGREKERKLEKTINAGVALSAYRRESYTVV